MDSSIVSLVCVCVWVDNDNVGCFIFGEFPLISVFRWFKCAVNWMPRWYFVVLAMRMRNDAFSGSFLIFVWNHDKGLVSEDWPFRLWLWQKNGKLRPYPLLNAFWLRRFLFEFMLVIFIYSDQLEQDPLVRSRSSMTRYDELAKNDSSIS